MSCPSLTFGPPQPAMRQRVWPEWLSALTTNGAGMGARQRVWTEWRNALIHCPIFCREGQRAWSEWLSALIVGQLTSPHLVLSYIDKPVRAAAEVCRTLAEKWGRIYRIRLPLDSDDCRQVSLQTKLDSDDCRQGPAAAQSGSMASNP